MSWEEWAFRPHPVYPLPTREQVEVACKTPEGKAKFQEVMQARGDKLRLENERAAAWARERKAKQVAKKSK